MEYKFRDLKSNEIDVRVSQVGKDWLTLLLYKDARVDMNILDETVKPENWQRDHKELKGNIYCGISIWDEEKKQWITKWDAGKESNTEAEKGEASDSFKRAGTNWGIGRELYTSPMIFIPIEDVDGEINYITSDKNGKTTVKSKFYVEAIQIEKKEITALSIKNNKNKRVFLWKKEEGKKVKKDEQNNFIRKIN